MSGCSDFTSPRPTPMLDPLRVGEVMGLDAFTVGDWAILRTRENQPVKVARIHQDWIFVEQGMDENLEYALVHHYPEELGYPLDHRFWSLYQKRSYLRCHLDNNLLRRWQRAGNVLDHTVITRKGVFPDILTGVCGLLILGFWLCYEMYG